MAYTFDSVEIIAFDVHTAVKPVPFPKLLKPEFKFLSDSKEYARQYESRQAVETDAFIVSPIKKREFSRNHFWKNYAAASFAEDVDYWGLQIPFVLEPRSLDLKPNLEGLGFQAEAETYVFLHSVGWSSNIRLWLTGDIKAAQLREFVGRLRGEENSDAPLLVAGEKRRLTAVFRDLGRMVKTGVYASPDMVDEHPTVSNQLVICLKRSTTATPKYFKEEWGLVPPMDDDERAELLGILYGRKVTAGEPGELKRYTEKTTVTRFRGRNFSLTNFAGGTLLFMQDEATGSRDKTESLGCLTANVRSGTMMSLALLEFDQAAGKVRGDAPVLKALRERAEAALVALPRAYKNAYLKNLYRHHDRLKKFYEEDGEDGDIDF